MELIGDQIDLAMFKYSKYQYIESKHPKILFEIRDQENNKQFEVLKVFEFESHLQRMSVIVYDVKGSKYYIYTKGAYEVIEKITGKNQNLQFSNNLLDSLSLQGLRVLATSYKEIQANQINYDREKLENDQLFLGLVGFENQLKSDTKDIIQELREANIINKVISGDNILTTIQTSRLATIIDNNFEYNTM
ncbi:P-type ATPase, cytoplasmic domain N [Pseudocohnilembus persalinus]|uniref:P-type ATPase, cytoplasmic domain N n=1 Tax=Pseudocohnilembus persalinus TaxID=266149 RepID=A0A0V0QD05_PSEPJ|nr:P-type ATPase, cytoplasmic domain N [Pseudocohnilembus persalinus]|eukprot:KRX00016.1 P-type ATPase, cytoplasmic domain N [Pseudocohnilembus persalinus]